MAKILPFEQVFLGPAVYICHLFGPGPGAQYAWHQIFDGVYDDIYFFMACQGGHILSPPPDHAYEYARHLAADPQSSRRLCSACNFNVPPIYQPHPNIPQWQHRLDWSRPAPAAIYWPHDYDNEVPPPGFYYPWPPYEPP